MASRGRPRSDNPRTRRLKIKCTDAEFEAIASRAEEHGLDIATWVRSISIKGVFGTPQKSGLIFGTPQNSQPETTEPQQLAAPEAPSNGVCGGLGAHLIQDLNSLREENTNALREENTKRSARAGEKKEDAGRATKRSARAGEKKEDAGRAKGENDYSCDFETFWLAFPSYRRRDKADAWKAWVVAITKCSPEKLIASAKEYAASPLGQSEFVKMPATWLRKGSWEDDRQAWEMRTQQGPDLYAGLREFARRHEGELHDEG